MSEIEENAEIGPVQDDAGIKACRARADGLVRQMNLEEKVSFVSTYFPILSEKAKQYGMVPSSGYNPGLARLGIPELRINDASLGVSNLLNARPGDTATALPSALATGATFDPEIAFAGGAMIGSEARAKRFNVMLAGGINLTRDPWAGRNFEYIGEDPVHTGRLGGAAVAGVQSNNIASTVKHFVLNSQETGRMVMDARIDEGALRESDLLAFEIAIEVGRPASVMTSYNKINGEYGGEHDGLINGVLKGDWAYPGWVMSDWGATHSTCKAALAGLDQESGLELDAVLNGAVFFTDRLVEAVNAGDVSVARLDDMVSRILTGMLYSGAMDDPAPASEISVDRDLNASVAQTVAEAGAVLLRNEQSMLPLSDNLSRITVIGGHADVGVLSGGGSSQVRSHGGAPIEEQINEGDGAWFCRMTYHASPPLAAICARVPGAEVRFCSGEDAELAAKLASESDVVVVFATQWQSEARDASSLSLPGGQDELIQKVAAANSDIVVVLETGGPVLMPWLDQVRAVLLAWYPGQRGGEAIARLLFGDVSPSGRLPITFPAAEEQAPRPKPGGLAQLKARDAAKAAGDAKARIEPFAVEYIEGANVGYRWYELMGHSPLFPFGYGLSYTSFRYDNLEIVGEERPRVYLDITNTGACAGADVPQAYVRAADGEGKLTWRLAGFRRVELGAGETARVELELESRAFSVWDQEGRRWVRQPGQLPVAIGRSSVDHKLFGELTGDS